MGRLNPHLGRSPSGVERRRDIEKLHRSSKLQQRFVSGADCRIYGHYLRSLMTEKVKANKVAQLYLFIENTNSEGFLGAIRGVYGEGVDGGGYENTKNAESAHDGTGHMHFEGIEVRNLI
jgi:hypothetical protein